MSARKWLGDAWAAWKRIGQLVGDVIARVVLTIFYFSILVPFGLGVRLLRRDSSGRWTSPTDLWSERPSVVDSLDRARRLY